MENRKLFTKKFLIKVAAVFSALLLMFFAFSPIGGSVAMANSSSLQLVCCGEIDTNPSGNCRYSLFFHGIPVGDRTYLLDFYLRLEITERQGFRVHDASGSVTALNAPWSGSFGSRAEQHLGVELAFPHVGWSNQHSDTVRFPVMRFDMWICVPSGALRHRSVFPYYYVIPQEPLYIGISNNFFVAMRHSNIPNVNFNHFQLTLPHHHHGLLGFAANGRDWGDRSTLATFRANARLGTRKVDIGTIDPDSPFFNINFGGTGNSWIRPPGHGVAAGRPSRGCQGTVNLFLIFSIIGGVIIVFGFFMWFGRRRGGGAGGSQHKTTNIHMHGQKGDKDDD